MKICKDGRISGQNNKEAGGHLGILTGRIGYIKKGGSSGDKNPMFGKRHSIESRGKMGGANNGNWKGGTSYKHAKFRGQIEYKLWRNAVLARDSWTCQECGQQGGRLNAHHIKSSTQYPELKFAIDNGSTLCFDCHKLTSNFAGRNKFNDSNVC